MHFLSFCPLMPRGRGRGAKALTDMSAKNVILWTAPIQGGALHLSHVFNVPKYLNWKLFKVMCFPFIFSLSQIIYLFFFSKKFKTLMTYAEEMHQCQGNYSRYQAVFCDRIIKIHAHSLITLSKPHYLLDFNKKLWLLCIGVFFQIDTYKL